MSRPVEINFLYWKECPSHPKAWERLQQVLQKIGLQADIRRVEVKTEEEAKRLRFSGSPTIRINNQDIDPKGAADQPYRLTCRIYTNRDGKVTPVPPEELFLSSLKNL